MFDLSAHVFYKAHFDIETTVQRPSVFNVVTVAIKDWLTWKYDAKVAGWDWRNFGKFGDFRTNDCTVEASTTSFRDENLLYWACKIEEYQTQNPENEDTIVEAPRIWTTEVGFEQISATKATISYVLYYRDKAGFIGKIADPPVPNVPGFIKTLLFSRKINCTCGDEKLLVHAQSIEAGRGMNVAERIKMDGRKVPYIIVSPLHTENDEIVFPVDPENIAKNVMSNAIVYFPATKEALEELNYFLPKELMCNKGRIMIYWPSNSPIKYRYISAYQAEILGENEVINILRRAFSTDIKYYDAHEMFRMSDCNELYRKKRFSELKFKVNAATLESVESALTNAELGEQIRESKEYIKLADEVEAEQRETINQLREMLNEQKQDNWNLQSRIQSMESVYLEAQDQLSSLNNIQSISSLPNTPEKIAAYFQLVYKDKIDFTERGLRSLKSCLTSPDILWECFYMIATYLPDLFRDGVADIETAFKEKTSWDLKRGEGKMTRKDPRLMAQRSDTYMGREIDIEPHIANGNKESDPDFIRVYFAYDAMTKKIIIGHVGKHLDNYSTRKQ